jgi:hypothetical protein
LEQCFSRNRSPRRLSMRSRPNAGTDWTQKNRRGRARRRFCVKPTIVEEGKSR